MFYKILCYINPLKYTRPLVQVVTARAVQTGALGKSS